MSQGKTAQLYKNLQFDEVTMDVSLAKQYLQKNIIEKGSSRIILLIKEDQDHKKIHKAVAQRIRENECLFAQLMHLECKWRIDDVLEYDIPMIASQFENNASIEKLNNIKDNIYFERDVPLATLGFVAKSLNSCLIPDSSTAAVAHLFVSICRESGFSVSYDLEKLSAVTRDSFNIVGGFFTPDTCDGSVLVVTDRADAASAAAAAAAAATDRRYPWALCRVIVQESLVGGVRAALAGGPPVEPYRTTRELLALLRRLRPLYLSLWCSDLSTAHEVAHACSARTLWINGFGDLTHSTFYTGYDFLRQKALRCEIRDGKDGVSEDRLISLYGDWVEKSFEQRKEVILSVLEKHESLKHLMEETKARAPPPSFARVAGGRMWMGVPAPADAPFRVDWEHIRDVQDALNLVLNGNGILICKVSDESYLSLFSDLEKSGVPLVASKDLLNTLISPVVTLLHDLTSSTKVITFSFGETFAN